MADDIKIKVGVQSSVKADMDRLVADMNKGVASMPKATMGELLERGKVIDTARKKEKAIEENEAILDSVRLSAQGQAAEYKKVADKISEEFGIAGEKSGAAYKRSLSGSGIRSALTQMIRGDVSGAIESLSEGLNLGMKSIAAKAVVWGGGILTAIAAGWKAGKALDEMLGISSKIADLWAGPALKGVGDTVEKLQAARKEAEAIKDAAEKTAQANARFEEKRSNIRMDRSAIGGTAQDKLNVENERMVKLFNEAHKSGLSLEESNERMLAYEEQLNIVKAAGLAADKEAIDIGKKKADEKRKLAEDEMQWNKEIADADTAARKAAFQRDVDLAAQLEQDELKAIARAAELQQEKDNARKDKLSQIMKDNAFGSRLIDDASTSRSYAAAKKKDRQEVTEWNRGVRQAEQAQARFDKGIATDRDLALLGGLNAQAKAKAARDEMAKMDKDAKQAAIDTAKNTRALHDKIDAIGKAMDGIARG